MDKLFGLRNVNIARNKFCKYPVNVLVILHLSVVCILDKIREFVKRINFSVLIKKMNP